MNGLPTETKRSALLCALLLLGMLAGDRGGRAQSAPEKIAVWVNGEAITQADFFDRLQRLRAQDFVASVNPLTLRSENAGQIVLNSMINERLILQWAAKTKDLPSDADVQQEITTLKQQPNVTQLLASKQITEEMLKYDIRVQRARFNIATAAVTVSAKEIEDYYKRNIARYTIPERWGLSAIRTSKPAILAKIQNELKAGTPFAQVAKSYTEDAGSREKGGELGLFTANDNRLPAPIRDAVKKLAIGEVSPAIKIEINQGESKAKLAVWYLMRLTSKEAEKPVPFGQVKQQVERLALLERAGGYETADKKIADYRKSAKIEINLPGYQALLPSAQK